jgi:hypothetical protein
VLIQKGKAREFRFYLRLYSSGEISDLLTRAGFTKVDIYGGVDGAPYDNTSRWLVAVARK